MFAPCGLLKAGFRGGPLRLSLLVSVASVVCWHQRYRRTGRVEPDSIGGDRHSHRAEARAARVLGWIDENRDITLFEIAERLAVEGNVFAPATIWRPLNRRDYLVENRPLMPQNRIVLT